jgi:hypothetical protein
MRLLRSGVPIVSHHCGTHRFMKSFQCVGAGFFEIHFRFSTLRKRIACLVFSIGDCLRLEARQERQRLLDLASSQQKLLEDRTTTSPLAFDQPEKPTAAATLPEPRLDHEHR